MRKRLFKYKVVIEKDADGYYVASVPALLGCHTQAKSLSALIKRIDEAIHLCLEVQLDSSSSAKGGLPRHGN